MKKYSFILLCAGLAFGQTPAERNKIVSTYDPQKVAELKAYFESYMAEQKAAIELYKAQHPELKEDEKHSLQRIFYGIPHFFTVSNDGSSKTIRANAMYPGGELGLEVNGLGMVAGVWDGGKVRNTHQEFPDSKVMLNDDATEMSHHATHVTGTICAAGVSAARRGIAYAASAITHDWSSDVTEMTAFASAGYLVSNHSYGYNTENLPNWRFGQYDQSSIEIDMLANTFPYYQVVIAAGNDRNSTVEQSTLEGGYDLLSGTGTSKNGITVAAVDELLNYEDPSEVMISSFSNFGPPDDGRVKPDIAAKGTGVDSCTSMANATYGIMNGTSMAAPAITGLVLLLQQHYTEVTGSYMRASTVRGLICHSAREAGLYPGPDYEHGWGLADGLAAANIITQNGSTTILEEHPLANGEVYTRQITVSEPQNIRVSICWNDPVGTANGSASNDNRSPRLKNNLDLKVLKDGQTFYPWSLNPDDPTSPGSNWEDNNVDNIEVVDIEFAMPGTYTIQVNHKGTLIGSPQIFSLIATSEMGLTLAANEYDYRDSVAVYPNPVKSVLNFAIPQNGEVNQVEMFDLLGKEVKVTSQPVNNSMDVTNLASGIYFVKFMVNGTPMVRKFIKE